MSLNLFALVNVRVSSRSQHNLNLLRASTFYITPLSFEGGPIEAILQILEISVTMRCTTVSAGSCGGILRSPSFVRSCAFQRNVHLSLASAIIGSWDVAVSVSVKSLSAIDL